MNTNKNDELIDVLTAISVVSKRLATNIAKLEAENQQEKGETYEQYERSADDNRRTIKVCRCNCRGY